MERRHRESNPRILEAIFLNSYLYSLLSNPTLKLIFQEITNVVMITGWGSILLEKEIVGIFMHLWEQALLYHNVQLLPFRRRRITFSRCYCTENIHFRRITVIFDEFTRTLCTPHSKVKSVDFAICMKCRFVTKHYAIREVSSPSIHYCTWVQNS